MILTGILTLGACTEEDPTSSTGSSTSTSSTTTTYTDVLMDGDTLVSSNVSDSVTVLDPLGNYKATLYNTPNYSEVLYGLGWMTSLGAALVSVDGSDRILAISAETGNIVRTFSHAAFAGTLRGATQLAGGDLLFIESNTIERFTSTGYRVTSGWPKSLQNSAQQIDATSAGGFVLCSSGADKVSVYDADGVEVYTRTSGIPGTTNGMGCRELDDGTIAVAWNGSTDSVAFYSSDLSTTLATYSDTTLLADVYGIDQASNGNILAAGRTFEHLVEIDTSGNFVNTRGGHVLIDPIQVQVVRAPEKGSVNTPHTPQALESGDLLVSNNTGDSLVHLDPNGNFKTVVYDVINNSETIYGVGWSNSESKVIFNVDGADRIMGIDPATGSVSTVLSDANFSGTLRGLTQLASGGDYLLIESNNIERYNPFGFRVTSGWPQSLQTTPQQISPHSGGGFVLCSSGSDKVSIYDSSGSETATRTSGIPSTTDATGCLEMSNGNIAVSWAGTTDTIGVYSSDLTTVVATYSNTVILPLPYGITQRSDGNLLIVDSTYHHIVELSETLQFVRIIGDGVLSTPRQIYAMP